MTNQERARQFLPLIQAVADGKQIEYHGNWEKWVDIDFPYANRPAAAYRIKPEPPPVEYVPLEASDVPPGSAIVYNKGIGIQYPIFIGEDHVVILNRNNSPAEYSFKFLYDGCDINRSIPETGKWDPKAWQPCRKVKPQ